MVNATANNVMRLQQVMLATLQMWMFSVCDPRENLYKQSMQISIYVSKRLRLFGISILATVSGQLLSR